MCDALPGRAVAQQLLTSTVISSHVQPLTRGEPGELILLGAETCAPDIGLTGDKAQCCSELMEEINSAGLAAEPPQHT